VEEETGGKSGRGEGKRRGRIGEGVTGLLSWKTVSLGR